MLLEDGVLKAVAFCLQAISWVNGALFKIATEGQHYVGNLGGKSVILIEVKSPLIMKKMSESLLVHGCIKLDWGTDEPLASRILHKVSTHVFKHSTNLDHQHNCVGCSLLGVEHVVHLPPHIPIGMHVHTRLGCNCERSHRPGHNCGPRLT